MSNVLVELSNAMAAAAEKAGASTVLVNARRRMPASGIVFAADLVLTADHVIEQEDGITVVLPDGAEVAAKLAGAIPARTWLSCAWKRQSQNRLKLRLKRGSVRWCWHLGALRARESRSSGRDQRHRRPGPYAAGQH